MLGPDLSRLDVLMAALCKVEPTKNAQVEDKLAPATALLAKWCSAFFAPSSGRLMRDRDLGLYRAIRPMLAADRELSRLATVAAPEEVCGCAAQDPVEAVTENLEALALSALDRERLIERLIAALPGWAGHIRWRNAHAGALAVEDAPATIADLLALSTLVLRVTPERAQQALREPLTAKTRLGALAAYFGLEPSLTRLHAQGQAHFREIAAMTELELGLLFMRAAERHFRDSLVAKIGSTPVKGTTVRCDAQLVFCIDVRSEPFRRAIEAQGSYETFGYAGFFGVPMALRAAGDESSRKQLPVLLEPQFELVEQPVAGLEQQARSSSRKRRAADLARQTVRVLKDGLATSFSAAEAIGPAAAALMALRTFAPKRCFKLSSTDAAAIEDSHAPSLQGALQHDDELAIARAFFELTGLCSTAPLVLFVGHGGSAVNNPYAAALDCGACGGHRGGANARVLAAILNKAAIRDSLAAEGFRIGSDTVFAAAEHDTTCDTARIFDVHLVPATHRRKLGVLMDDLAAAGASCRQERAAKLRTTEGDLDKRATHWGEVRPEWGLAGNAAFVVGRRSLTRDSNLEGRVFLHSYEWKSDPDGTALETILTAPMVVAQWINCQYLFSTVDNQRYGAGDKITHNVLGGIGVVQGNGGDLCIGLPRQSLFDDDGLPFHTPQRLLTIVEAPIERIEMVIERNAILERLFGNEWVHLIAVDPVTGRKVKWRTCSHRSVQNPAAHPF